MQKNICIGFFMSSCVHVGTMNQQLLFYSTSQQFLYYLEQEFPVVRETQSGARGESNILHKADDFYLFARWFSFCVSFIRNKSSHIHVSLFKDKMNFPYLKCYLFQLVICIKAVHLNVHFQHLFYLRKYSCISLIYYNVCRFFLFIF